LIVEPIPPGSLLSLLTSLQDITDNFPDMDQGLLTLDDITL
jgi:antitoxin VapB